MDSTAMELPRHERTRTWPIAILLFLVLAFGCWGLVRSRQLHAARAELTRQRTLLAELTARSEHGSSESQTGITGAHFEEVTHQLAEVEARAETLRRENEELQARIRELEGTSEEPETATNGLDEPTDARGEEP